MQALLEKWQSKLLPNCELAITGIRCVKKIVTDLAVAEDPPLKVDLILKERAPGVSVEEIEAKNSLVN